MKRIFTIVLVGFFISVSMVSYGGQWTVNGLKTYYKVAGGSIGIGTDTPVGAFQVQSVGQDRWIYFQNNIGGGVPLNNPGLSFGWNKSNGEGESQFVYNKSTGNGNGSRPRFSIASLNGSIFTEEAYIKDGSLTLTNQNNTVHGGAYVELTAFGTNNPGGRIKGDLHAADAGSSVSGLILSSYNKGTYMDELRVVEGKVGILTDEPHCEVDVNGNLMLRNTSNTQHSGASIQFTANGWQNPGAVIRGDLYNAQIGESISGLVLSSFNKGYMDEITIIKGQVGIRTSEPDATLTVNGDIHAKEVRLDLSVPGPDYVFENDYRLRTPQEVAEYLKKNKHLPEVPSAREMETTGINVADMNMILLKKVEELTLYMIKQQEEIEKLKVELKNVSR